MWKKLLRNATEVVEFYVDRDLRPARWYGRARNGAGAFDDLPARYRENVNAEVPFLPLPGNRPRLTAAEISDVIAFLETLTDGYAPAAQARP